MLSVCLPLDLTILPGLLLAVHEDKLQSAWSQTEVMNFCWDSARSVVIVIRLTILFDFAAVFSPPQNALNLIKQQIQSTFLLPLSPHNAVSLATSR